MDHSPRLKLVICGGGASAVLLLTALRRRFRSALEATIIEPREDLGLGVAYSTRCPLHVLNTRAGNMSCTHEPEDFLQWLRREHPRRPLNWTRDDFAPRSFYGEYLQTRLKEVQTASNVRFKWLRTTADSILARDNEWEVVPAQGNPIRADVVVLATGNEAPRSIGSRAEPKARPFILDDPWDAAAHEDLPREAGVLLVGTGLTAVDVAVELLHRGHDGPIYAVSRRGLLPRVHVSPGAAIDGGAALPISLRDLVRHTRAIVERDPQGAEWREFFNKLRLVAPALWEQWNWTERRRFLRHVRPFWEVHRHRLAQAVHSRIARAQTRGQLHILRGRVADIEALQSDAGVRVRVKGRQGEQTLDVARVINCTGPDTDPRFALNPLLQSLVGDSLALADPLGLGLAVDRHSRVLASNGMAHHTLYALGPLTRGSRWEVTSVQEIRQQAVGVAERLARDFAALSTTYDPAPFMNQVSVA